MRRAVVALGLAGVVTEAGCIWIWVMSPRLTAIYNPEFTAQFFERLPGLRQLRDGVLGALGLLGAPTQDVNDMVVRLEVGLALLIVGYVSALVALTSARGSFTGAARGPGWLLVGFALVFRLTVLLLPGLFSTDVFSYVLYGRIAAVHGQNPYVVPPSNLGDDPFLAWVFPFWRDQPTVYGPAWTDSSWLLSRLTASLSNFDQVMGYRFSLGAIELATLGLLWWQLGRLKPDDGSPRARMAAWALYAWNPLVLFDLVGNSHNDVAMLVLLLVGVALMTSRPPRLWFSGLVAMTLSALVKYATGLVVLLWAVTWAAQGGTSRQQVIRLGAGIGLPLALAIALWWPWLQTSQALLPLTEAVSGRLVINSAPDVVALTVADQLLKPAGMDLAAAQAAARFWMRAITRAAFVAYLAWELRRMWLLAAYAGSQPAPGDEFGQPMVQATLEASVRVLLVLPLLVMTWVWSWYFSWSLVLAALLGARSGLTRLVVAYTLFVLPVVTAHQYLNEAFSGIFVVAFAVIPMLALLARRGATSMVGRCS